MTRLAGWRVAALALIAWSLTGCAGRDRDDEEQPPGDAIDPTFLDASVAPCDDFYRFACGSWIDQHPTTEQAPIQARFSQGGRRNDTLLERILITDAAGEPVVPHANAAALGQFFTACKAAHRALATSDQDLVRGRLNVIAAIQTSDDLAVALASLHHDGVSALFEFAPSTNLNEPSQRIPVFWPATLSMPDPLFYGDTTELGQLAALQAHISDLLTRFAPGQFTATPEAIAAVEQTLAKAQARSADQRSPELDFTTLSARNLEQLLSHFSWSRYLLEAKTGNFPWLGLMQPDYVAAVDSVVSGDLNALKGYLAFRTLESFAGALGPSVDNLEWAFHHDLFYGATEIYSSDWMCTQVAMSWYPFALSQPFVTYRTTPAARQAATQLTDNLQSAFQERLGNASWLDPDSRERALEKLAAVIKQVDYPDQFPDTYFGIGNTFLERSLDLAKVLTTDAWSRLNEPLARDRWTYAPLHTNAYYIPTQNAVSIPAGILQTPEFGLERSVLLNYATLGSILGHELTHGFDNTGRHFDGDGRLSDWWTPDSAAEFERRAACLRDQYSNYQVLPGLNVDGELTLGENIADLGGVRLAYAAYGGEAQASPELAGFDAKQQFFIAYAQLWCESDTDQELELQVLTDPHSPPALRVNGVLQNSPEFAEAFQCAPDSPMVRTNRCEIF